MKLVKFLVMISLIFTVSSFSYTIPGYKFTLPEWGSKDPAAYDKCLSDFKAEYKEKTGKEADIKHTVYSICVANKVLLENNPKTFDEYISLLPKEIDRIAVLMTCVYSDKFILEVYNYTKDLKESIICVRNINNVKKLGLKYEDVCRRCVEIAQQDPKYLVVAEIFFNAMNQCENDDMLKPQLTKLNRIYSALLVDEKLRAQVEPIVAKIRTILSTY